jgi:CheY-like chemotaxis protein
MFAQLFGKYLIGKSIIKEDIFKEIVEKQKSVRVKLGTIAVAEGLLTEEQTEEINALQRQQDKRFGDIAIENGLLTPEQMESLLSKQGSAYLQFIQLLTEKTGLTTSDADQLVKAFQKDSGYTDAEMEALKADDIDNLIPLFVVSSKPHIRELAALVTRNLVRFVSSDFYLEKAQHVKDYEYDHLTSQELSGDDNVFVGIACTDDDDASFVKVASAFSEQEISSAGASAYDAIGEFINVTNGLYVTEISKKDIALDMEPPLSFSMQTAKGDFYVLPIYLEGHKMDVVLSINAEFIPGENPEKTSAVFFEAPIGGGELSLGKILIVDDSRMSRNILRNILEKAGYSISGEASNGVEAVDAFQETCPDLVTLDITMPQMDGLEALTKILEIDPDAKAIMITAAGQQDKLIKALKVGAKRFINKPFKEDEILKNISDVLKESE